MGYRKKYNGLRIVKYSETPSGRKLKNKYIIIDNANKTVSTIRGLSLLEAKKWLPYYQNIKEFKFTG